MIDQRIRLLEKAVIQGDTTAQISLQNEHLRLRYQTFLCSYRQDVPLAKKHLVGGILLDKHNTVRIPQGCEEDGILLLLCMKNAWKRFHVKRQESEFSWRNSPPSWDIPTCQNCIAIVRTFPLSSTTWKMIN